MIADSLVRLGVWVESTPGPTAPAVPDPGITSPGIVGFVVTFVLALACVLLFLSLTKQLRRVNRRAALLAEGEDTRPGADPAVQQAPVQQKPVQPKPAQQTDAEPR